MAFSVPEVTLVPDVGTGRAGTSVEPLSLVLWCLGAPSDSGDPGHSPHPPSSGSRSRPSSPPLSNLQDEDTGGVK